MSYSQLEKEVKHQASILDKIIPKYLESESFKGKFIAFFDGVTLFGETHKECFEKAEKNFGAKTAYVIDEIAEKKLIVSALVKL